jgi:hypothetical protein
MFTLDLSHINIENFRLPANEWLKNFKNTGVGFYIDAPKHSYEWIKYWDEQEYYCKNGYSVGGVRITGEHYFYLNFCQIQLKTGFGSEVLKGKKKVEKLVTFPDFWDSDWFYFTECELAREAGQHMIILKPRRRGYSYKNAAKCAYNYTFLRKSTSLIIAESSDYSEETMGMAVSYLDFLMKYTDFGKNRLINKPKDEILAGYEEVLADGTKTRSGSFSRLLAMTAKNNASVARGKDANVILFEECFGKDTPVLMYDGSIKNIQNIKIGDFVMGKDGSKRTVLNTTTGTDDLYLVKQQKGINYVVNSKHKLVLEQKCNNKCYTNDGIKEYTVGEFRKLIKYKQQTSYGIKSSGLHFEEKKLPFEPYWLGLWLGDGDKTEANIVINVEADCEIENYIKEYATRLNAELRINKCNKTPKCKTFTLREKPQIKNKFTTLLKDLNIHCNKHIPNIYKFSSLEQRLELLAGFIDSDGFLHKGTSHSFSYEIIQANYRLIKDLEFLANSCGFATTLALKESKEGYRKNGVYFRLHIKGDYRKIPVKIKRKKVVNWEPTSNPLNTRIKIEDFGKGEYYGITVDKDNLFLLSDFTIVHNCGSFTNLKATYAATRPTVEEGLGVSGQIFAFGTGGDFSAGIVDFDEMFYNPEPYNFRAYKNVFEEGMELTQIGYFLPDYYSKGGFISEKGESQIEEAKIYIEGEIENKKRTSKDPNAVDVMLAEFPRTPKEAFIKASSNIFPKAELQAQINYIKSSRIDESLGVCGELVDKDGEIIFNPSDKAKPIDSFPLKKDSDREGCFVQYQAPYKEENRVPNNLYYIGHDPYGVDSEKGESLGSLFVFKQVNNISQPDDLIVAEYTARPSAGQDEYNRIMIMIAKYYNAKIGFENDRGNVIQYCRTNKVLSWLQEEADIYDKGEKVSNSLSRGYGMSMSNLKKKQQGCLYLRDWLLCRRGVDPSGKIKLNLNMIYSVPLLEELIKFEYDGNFDRVSACIIAMYYQKQIESKSIDRPQYVYNTDPFFTKFDSLGNFNSNY